MELLISILDCDRYVHSLYDVLKKGEYSETISIV
jgi:hypothetical protein